VHTAALVTLPAGSPCHQPAAAQNPCCCLQSHTWQHPAGTQPDLTPLLWVEHACCRSDAFPCVVAVCVHLAHSVPASQSGYAPACCQHCSGSAGEAQSSSSFGHHRHTVARLYGEQQLSSRVHSGTMLQCVWLEHTVYTAHSVTSIFTYRSSRGREEAALHACAGITADASCPFQAATPGTWVEHPGLLRAVTVCPFALRLASI
jgi:hypothetical protein